MNHEFSGPLPVGILKLRGRRILVVQIPPLLANDFGAQITLGGYAMGWRLRENSSRGNGKRAGIAFDDCTFGRPSLSQ